MSFMGQTNVTKDDPNWTIQSFSLFEGEDHTGADIEYHIDDTFAVILALTDLTEKERDMVRWWKRIPLSKVFSDLRGEYYSTSSEDLVRFIESIVRFTTIHIVENSTTRESELILQLDEQIQPWNTFGFRDSWVNPLKRIIAWDPLQRTPYIPPILRENFISGWEISIVTWKYATSIRKILERMYVKNWDPSLGNPVAQNIYAKLYDTY